MKLIIAGGRDFRDWQMLETTMLAFVAKHWMPTEIVCGMAPGADSLGLEWATRCNIQVTPFRPQWKKHGRAAGPIRNKEMAEYADAGIVFWDGQSKGSENMIEELNKLDKLVVVMNYYNPAKKKT